MSDLQKNLAVYLEQTLSPQAQIRKQAEASLLQLEKQPSFAIFLLTLIGSSQCPDHVRISAALYFKNYIRRSWEQTDNTEDIISSQDRLSIKKDIIALMITLPTSIQLQLGEAISIIADCDFPSHWPSLISDLVSQFSPLNIQVNFGILQTAHMVFNRYRSEFRTDMLFSEIKFVLNSFFKPYFEIFVSTDQLLLSCTDPNSGKILLDSLKFLIIIYYDLNCQDLPEPFEDNMPQFMDIMHRYLTFDSIASINPNLSALDNESDESTGILVNIKAEIFKVVQLYTNRYEDDFKQLPAFLDTIWTMLTSLDSNPKHDSVVVQGILFLTTMVKNIRYKSTFESNSMISTICEKIVLRNIELSESDQELFEDDPIMYVRRELEGSEVETRRNAAAGLVHGLLQYFGSETTQTMLHFIMNMLDQYSKNPTENWKAKDAAQFMVTSISAVASVKSLGITQTNTLVDLADFYQSQMLPHISNVHSDSNCPILKSNAIKYIYVFRNQLPDSYLEQAFPYIVEHLSHPNPVINTFAALTLERLMILKKNNSLVFGESKISPYAQNILEKLFNNILSISTSEKMAENDFFAKLIMRTIISCRNGISNLAPALFEKLSIILKNVCINPSNPLFNHFLFESIASLSRFTCKNNPTAVESIESVLFPQFQIILENEISDFMPYTFQILSLLLTLHKDKLHLSPVYISLLQPILQPILWDYQGNIPALVGLLQSYFAVNGQQIAQNGQLEPILGIFQKLISSKANDHYAFALLSSIVLYAPLNLLSSYFKAIFMLILNRLQTKKTPKFVKAFTQFIGFFCSIDVNLSQAYENQEGGYSNQLVTVMEQIQPQLLSNLLSNVLLDSFPTISSVNETKYTSVGYFRLVNSLEYIRVTNYEILTPKVMSSVIKLIEDTGSKLKTLKSEEDDADSEKNLDDIDINDITYQSSYSKLATLDNLKIDPCAKISDPRIYIGSEIKNKLKNNDTVIQTILLKLSPQEKAYIESYTKLS
ncbi:hypothetical protein BB561_004340 [Smittium simulii]|uniref:Importin N-terminal domain-containing protein n=1 Tax=Smittium simulii TaxID=133385 RepID=A0A2T9YGV9_9FUNG|nr:hypothetical protein BB561_004340 [Smittium simulii]